MTDPDATKPTIDGLSDADALELIGALVDHALDTADSVVVDEAM
nr:hypothetical protein [Sphingomonas populi]